MSACHEYLVEGRRQVAVALDALDVWQVLVALYQRIVVGLLVQLPMHQRSLLLACLCLRQQGSHQCCSAAMTKAAGVHTAAAPLCKGLAKTLLTPWYKQDRCPAWKGQSGRRDRESKQHTHP